MGKPLRGSYKMSKNIIVTSQGANLQIYYNLINRINKNGKLGFLTSFYRNFKEFQETEKNLDSVFFIKEWEIFEKSKLNVKVKSFTKLNNDFPPGILWGSILSDRRLIYGKKSKYIEDYDVRFSDNQLYNLIHTFLDEFEIFFKKIKPDVLIGSVPVTFGEVLAIEYCKNKNIPTLQLHSSRIENYFALHDKILGTSKHFLKIKKENNFSLKEKIKAKKILKDIRSNGVVYEGVNLKTKTNVNINLFSILRDLLYSIKHECKKYFDINSRNDNHDPGFLKFWYYKNFVQPFRFYTNQSFLKKNRRIIDFKRFSKDFEFCFYPLHTEPEVSIQVLGRPYHKNQIELLRNIGASLPFGMKLLVKEHPRSIGLRSKSFYKKLLEIPNLFFIDPQVDSLSIVKKSSFVAIISSTIGLESLIIGKPILVLGYPKYAELFEKGLIRCYNLFELPIKIIETLKLKKINEEEILSSLGALIKGSVPVNFYSKILKKADRYSVKSSLTNSEELKNLEKYFLYRINEVVK